MGEEEKVKEEAAAEKGKEAAVAEEKEAAAAGEEKKEDAPPPPPPPEEVVMRVFMHCEGCARKVKKILRGFDGVEDVVADSKAHKVIVKGKKAAADPMKVVHRVQKKTGRKVELLSPMPPPVEEKKEEEKKEEPEPPKPEEKEPTVIAVVLKVHMHCEACAQVIRKKILKMKGVQSAEPDMKASQVTVKGVFEESKLTDYVHKRIGKNAAVVKSEPAPPPENAGDANAKDDKKAAEGGEEKDESKEEKKEGDDEKEKEKEKDDSNAAEVEEKDKEKDPSALAAANLYMHYPRFSNPGGYGVPGYAYPYAPQLFSDENPNACVVM
ncbi:heavy metal-associated isoprenylated plant protein 7 [Oryza sativa Japonica Group]|uniref:Farnesylated protein n=2 Tax=Oryza sativa subsp. japonica TaxID=39947 RepID=A0A0N7KFC8_ORYSJ|nr:heavy metal-associated isoprenylated plant protein 7 [Oryza sativa Japonica Group]BAD23076.1 putative farnesylated protein [Oryza sativa Japonica Group]BAF08848.1 Os02g0510600 [Oryza sativa Japonica Group]BAS78857.1 Os02g0510600 [Oryza sativa Japonica Group]|eukprot:NP_001046934.1 Os02g0510600 [Oryza sativa Japonica Group]